MGIAPRSASGTKFSPGLKAMARVRNQKRDSSAKPPRQKKHTAKAKPADDSSDEQNLVTDAHEASDVCALIFILMTVFRPQAC